MLSDGGQLLCSENFINPGDQNSGSNAFLKVSSNGYNLRSVFL